MRPKTRDEFKIAIICALTLEADAVEALLDETYDNLSRVYGKGPGDTNAYTAGRIGDHNVVICYLSGMGIGSAASVAAGMKISYVAIELGLVVGICGAAPFGSHQSEIILGDVIVSDSVIQYDFGRQYPDGFQRKSDVTQTLGRPIQEIRNLLAGLRTRKMRNQIQQQMRGHLSFLLQQDWKYPGSAIDVIYESNFRHQHYYEDPTAASCICIDCKSSHDPICEEATSSDCTKTGCSRLGKPVERSRLKTDDDGPHPVVHIGTMASANTVMKSAEDRDRLVKREGVIGFEMEGAGVWDNVPCIIIKGVCDYSDSHKSKLWQEFAAATAASCAKVFLEYWRVEKPAHQPPSSPRGVEGHVSPAPAAVDYTAREPAKFKSFRISELPKNTTKESLSSAVLALLTANGENTGQGDLLCGLSVAPDPGDPDSYSVATVTFDTEPKFLMTKDPNNPFIDQTFQLKIGGKSHPVQIDSRFTHLTTLHCFEPVVDIVALSGLDGNGFASWSASDRPVMWLRDFLPAKIKNSRIFVYGYNADLELQRPLILLGHCLGGLVLKQALVQAATSAESSTEDRNLYESFIGALFFGVPNRGLNDKFLHNIVRDQPNQNLIRSLDPESAELKMLRDGFIAHFNRKKYEFYCYYEMRTTELSEIDPTTGQDNSTGEHSILVLESSATEAIPGQASHTAIPIDGNHKSIVRFSKRTDHDFQVVSSNILSLVKIAQDVLEKRAVKLSQDLPSFHGHFVVPYLENEKYITRPEIEGPLSRLVASELKAVLLGPGGAGKTQVALKMAYQSRQTRTVLWIDGKSLTSSLSSLVCIAHQVKLVKDGMTEKEIYSQLSRFLKSDESGNWLIVIDELSHTDKYFLDIISTGGGKGTLLVTSRSEDIPRILQARQLECSRSMTAEQARAMFHQSSGIDIDSKKLDETDVKALLKAIDYSPLAIVLMASYMRDSKTAVPDYLEMFQRDLPGNAKIVENQRLKSGGREDTPLSAVMTAFDITLRRVKRDSPLAADILSLLSFINSHNVQQHYVLESRIIDNLCKEKGGKLDPAIGILLSLSLVTVSKEHQYQIHDHIASIARSNIVADTKDEERFSKLALGLVEESLPDQNSPSMADYLQHVHAVLSHIKNVSALDLSRLAFQSKLADRLYESERFVEARNLTAECITYYEANKKDGIELADNAYRLARIEEDDKDYDVATKWCAKARDGFVTNLGKSHPRTLNALTRLATISEARGDYSNAVQTLEQVLLWSESQDETNATDPLVIDTVHHIALILDRQGHYDIAIEAYTYAWEESVNLVGEQHPYSLDVQNNLAISLRKQGKYNEALEMFKKVFEVYSKVLGKNDPSTVNVQGNIALITDLQGHHTMALQTYKGVLELKKKLLGISSPSTLSTLNNMALLESRLGNHGDAIAHAESALQGYRVVGGEDHPATLEAIANCAIIYAASGDIPRAKEYYEHSCWKKTLLLGAEHPSTLGTMSAFAALLVKLDNIEEAIALQNSVVHDYAVSFGKDHLFAINADVELSRMLMKVQRWDQAEACLLGARESLKAQSEPPKEVLQLLDKELHQLGDMKASKPVSRVPTFGK